MSGRANSPKLELKLNLSPPRANNQRVMKSSKASDCSSEMSVESPCMSSSTADSSTMMMRYRGHPEETSMMLVGCPRCLMYVMLSEGNPKCPRCKSTVLLDFLKEEEENTKKARN